MTRRNTTQEDWWASVREQLPDPLAVVRLGCAWLMQIAPWAQKARSFRTCRRTSRRMSLAEIAGDPRLALGPDHTSIYFGRATPLLSARFEELRWHENGATGLQGREGLQELQGLPGQVLPPHSSRLGLVSREDQSVRLA